MVTIHDRAYREFREQMKTMWRAAGATCYLDGQPIDWDGPKNEPNSFELDHLKSRKKHPELLLDPKNARPSHCRCNRSKQEGPASLPLGATSEAY